MNIFRRRHKEENTDTPAVASTAMPQQPATEQRIPDTMMDPRQVQEFIRQEAKRLRSHEHIMTAPQLARTREALRLAETKLGNIEENLEKCHEQKDWLRRFHETSSELDEQRNRQYKLNKQCAAVAQEEKELERFETFENVQGLFQKVQIYEADARRNKEEATALARRADELQREMQAMHKELTGRKQEMRDAEARLHQSHDIIEQAQRIEGVNAHLKIQEHQLTDRMQMMTSQANAMEKEVEEQASALEKMKETLEKHKHQRNNLEVHQQTAEHHELIIAKLGQLWHRKREQMKIETDLNEAVRRQTDENAMLNRVYAEFQEVESKIKQLSDELHIHRYNNVGLVSYDLQERVIMLRSRQHMLTSAQSLWNRIASGYMHIEEKERRLNQLRLTHEKLTSDIEPIENLLGTLRRTCKEKEYKYTVSKSQNVVQLRGDLQEGVQCTVCGATHHPFHSDTMLEQNLLISEMKTAYELEAAELRGKEKQLHEHELLLAANKAERECEENALHELRRRQAEDIKEWAVFSHLDKSFEECSSTGNLDARTSLLRQLLDNLDRDLTKAEQELKDFNFNQGRINELSEQLNTQEQMKNGLTVRLNEVNTGCQVMAGRVERLQKALEDAKDRYTALHEEIGKLITINGWADMWNRSRESLQMEIQQLVENWRHVNECINTEMHEVAMAELSLSSKQQRLENMRNEIAYVNDTISHRRHDINEGDKMLNKLLDGIPSKQHYDNLMRAYEHAKDEYEEYEKKAIKLKAEADATTARTEQVSAHGVYLDERTAQTRSELDVWIRQYNANHPPVQYAELARVFSSDKDWNECRTEIRNLKLEAALTEYKVDKLRSSLVSLQAEGYRNPTEDDSVETALATQMDALEKKRREVMLEIAELTALLNAHNKAEERRKKEEEGELAED